MIKITKTTEDATRYAFARIDENGESWDLGYASWSEDECGDGEFSGYFDTSWISFDDDDELLSKLSARKPNDEIIFA